MLWQKAVMALLEVRFPMLDVTLASFNISGSHAPHIMIEFRSVFSQMHSAVSSIYGQDLHTTIECIQNRMHTIYTFSFIVLYGFPLVLSFSLCFGPLPRDLLQAVLSLCCWTWMFCFCTLRLMWTMASLTLCHIMAIPWVKWAFFNNSGEYRTSIIHGNIIDRSIAMTCTKWHLYELKRVSGLRCCISNLSGIYFFIFSLFRRTWSFPVGTV